MPISGSCLCGGVRYEVTGQLSNAGNCHCSMCRRFSGTAFFTVASVEPDCLHWIAGKELVTKYQSSPEASRIFCKTCGSSLGVMENGKVTMISLGTISEDPGVRPMEHIFVRSKAPWYEITDELPQYQEWPPSE